MSAVTSVGKRGRWVVVNAVFSCIKMRIIIHTAKCLQWLYEGFAGFSVGVGGEDGRLTVNE